MSTGTSRRLYQARGMAPLDTPARVVTSLLECAMSFHQLYRHAERPLFWSMPLLCQSALVAHMPTAYARVETLSRRAVPFAGGCTQRLHAHPEKIRCGTGRWSWGQLVTNRAHVHSEGSPVGGTTALAPPLAESAVCGERSARHVIGWVQFDDAPYRGRARPSVEGTIPHPNQWQVELEPFTLPTRLLTRPGTAREDILAAIPGLVDERGEFGVTALLPALNPTRDPRRELALEKAFYRMVYGRSREPELERVRRGVYRTFSCRVRDWS